MNFFDDLNDKDRAQQYIEQGSEEWEQIRCGRFTSSEIYKLMEPGKRPMTKEELAARPKKGVGSKTTTVIDTNALSETAWTYIDTKVAEILTGQMEQSSYAYPLVYGKEMEPLAVEHFEKVTGLTCELVGFVPFGDHAGGSPDRLVEGKSILEIKCPSSSKNQIGYMRLTDKYDLKRMHPDKYWQCMSNLLFTGKEKCFLATFDPRYKKDKHKMHILELYPDQKEFQLIIDVLAVCIQKKLELLQSLD